uniref:Arylacetamide deacetylase like 4 n=1 Tax=Cebus imitator TaxID=2715852 RepID=A0A2K5REU2_CEBIM
MAVLWLVLLLALPVFFLGAFVWAVFEHFLTADLPATKLRALHCIFLYLWEFCSMPKFVRFLHDSMRIKKDPELMVTNLHFGMIPVRLFQPKAASSRLWRGIIFYQGGGSVFGSLDCYHGLCNLLAQETDSVFVMIGYRMVPDHHSPAIFHDCLNTSIYFLKVLETYGVDPSRVVVCVESIGGAVAATITQVLIYLLVQVFCLQLPSFQQNENVPFLSWKFVVTTLCNYLAIDLSWRDAILNGSCVPPEVWRNPGNVPKKFKKRGFQPWPPGPFNEAACLETKHMLDVENSSLLADDDVIAQLPEAFLVCCENDILRDDSLLYKKRLEDQGVRVTWYHLEEGFHGSLIFFDKKALSFLCSLKIVNAVVNYVKGM